MSGTHFLLLILAGLLAFGQDRELRSRTDVPGAQKAQQPDWVVAAGTKIPIQLRQPVSTKTAHPGDPIYAQTAFPVVSQGAMLIPAGTWVQGSVDSVKRAGRIKGTAELQFHLTQLIYQSGYTVDIAAAIDRVPGESGTKIQEPGVVKHDSEKTKDLEKTSEAAARGGQMGALVGAAANPSLRGFGVGGVTGMAAGTLIGILARGSDVSFPAGTSVEISLGHAMALDPGKVQQTLAAPVAQ